MAISQVIKKQEWDLPFSWPYTTRPDDTMTVILTCREPESHDMLHKPS